MRPNRTSQGNRRLRPQSITDDRRGSRASSQGRQPGGRRARRIALAPGPLPAGGPVLVGAFAAAMQGAARPPLAFTIQDIANGLTAGGAAVARRVADRV